MKPRISLISPRTLQMGMILLTASVTIWAEQPTPTPTPRPGGKMSLAEVAKDKQLKGGEKGKGIVITNENLADYAEKGLLTTAEEKEPKPQLRPMHQGGSTESGGVPPAAASGPSEERKRYWQGQYKRQLELVASFQKQMQDLDYEIPGLWRDFYAWDDPAYRDSVIKPKLDAALAQREKTEADLEKAETRLTEIKEGARKDGAEPGWFRGMTAPTPLPKTPTPEINR